MKSTATILVLALGIACTQSTPAQTFKKVKVALNTPIVQVASGGASVWALASNGNPYVFNGKSFVLATNISLSQIAVGGGNAAQADTVWALNSSGNIYHASKSGTTWTFSQIPGSLDLIAVGSGYQDSCHPYEVWGLNSNSQIYRYNFCLNNFDQAPGTLCDIHVGGGDVWGAQCGANVFRFDFATGAFDQVASPFASFPALTLGPNGGVWAIDTSTTEIWQYDPFSTNWQQEGFNFDQIQAGGAGLWGLLGNNIYHFGPNSVFGQQYWVQVPGSLVSISVGSGGGVWGIDGSHQIFAFSTP